MVKKETIKAALEKDSIPEMAEAPEIVAPAAPIESSAPIKRGRGRPPKNPQAVNGSAIPEGAPLAARRGRPPTKNKGLSIEAQANLAKQIQGLHFIAATATGLPELALSEVEAVMLADAVAAVSREYGLSLDGKTGAALQLLAAAAIVYAPRFKAINDRARSKPSEPNNVHDSAPAVH